MVLMIVITNNTTFNFTTTDDLGPIFMSAGSTPNDNDMGVIATANIIVDFDENTCKLEIVWDGEQIKALTDLPHRTESKKKINDIKIDGVSVFGKPALVAVELNDKGYNKVTSVSKPLASAAKRKVKAEPAAQDDIPV